MFKSIRNKSGKILNGILRCKGKDQTVVEYSIAGNLPPAMIADWIYRIPELLKRTLESMAEDGNLQAVAGPAIYARIDYFSLGTKSTSVSSSVTETIRDWKVNSL